MFLQCIRELDHCQLVELKPVILINVAILGLLSRGLGMMIICAHTRLKCSGMVFWVRAQGFQKVWVQLFEIKFLHWHIIIKKIAAKI